MKAVAQRVKETFLSVDGELISSNCGVTQDIRKVDMSNSRIQNYPIVFNYAESGEYEVVIEVACEYSSGITVLPIFMENALYKSNMTLLLVFRYFLIGAVAMFCISIIAMRSSSVS